MNTCYSDQPSVIGQALVNAYNALTPDPGNYTAVLSTNSDYSGFTSTVSLVLPMMADTTLAKEIAEFLEKLTPKHGRLSAATIYWDDVDWEYTITFLF